MTPPKLKRRSERETMKPKWSTFVWLLGRILVGIGVVLLGGVLAAAIVVQMVLSDRKPPTPSPFLQQEILPD